MLQFQLARLVCHKCNRRMGVSRGDLAGGAGLSFGYCWNWLREFGDGEVGVEEAGLAHPEAVVALGEGAGLAVAEAGVGFVEGADGAEGAGDGSVDEGKPVGGSGGGALGVGCPGKGELLPEARREPGGGEGVVPVWGTDAGADAGEDAGPEGSGGGVGG